MASLTQVAKQAGVSVTTASLVLNPGKQQSRISEACAARVRAAAATLGYVPNYHARSMKLGRSETVAVALDAGDPGDNTVQFLTSYFSTLLGGIEIALRKHGYQMTIIGPGRRTRAVERATLGLRQRRFDGVVVSGVLVGDNTAGRLQETPDRPCVVVEYAKKTPWPVIDWNEPAGMARGIAHLAQLGHKDVLWIGPAEGATHDAPSPRERLFEAAIREAGLRGRPLRYVLKKFEYDDRFGHIHSADEALAADLASGEVRRWTAVVAWNDKAAIGACRALTRGGLRVPADVSVIGFDDIEAALCVPALTTISHQLTEMGRRAGELVVRMSLEPELIAEHRGVRDVVEPQLVVRESTGPAARG